MKKIWISWESGSSIRSKVLAKEMNAIFFTFTLFEDAKYLSAFRYAAAILNSFFTILKERPKILVVQNPSVVLSYFSSVAKKIFGYYLIIDLHTHYINPVGIKKIFMNFLNEYSLRRANLIIVTNEYYRNKINNKSQNEIFVLPDKIPDFEYEFRKIELKGENNILFICNFSEDEPWEKVIETSKYLDKDTVIYISGKNKYHIKDIPSNIILTGFMPDEGYQNMLRSADIVMVLTTQENCLVCGGYEAVAAEKPLILSDHKVLREYFNKGTVFTKNHAVNIADSINLMIEKKAKYLNDIIILKREIKKEWIKTWTNLLKKID